MRKYIFGTLVASCAVVLGLFLHTLVADVTGQARTAASRDQLDKYLKNAYFAVVMFEDTDNAKLEDMFQGVSEDDDYMESALAFIQVNTQQAQVEGRLKTLQIDRLPAFVLYGKGDPIRDDDGEIVLLSGRASKKQLRNFIDDNIGGALEDIRSAKKEAMNEGYNPPAGVTVNQNYYYDTPYGGWWWWPYYFSFWYPLWWGAGGFWWGGGRWGHYGYRGGRGWRGGRGYGHGHGGHYGGAATHGAAARAGGTGAGARATAGTAATRGTAATGVTRRGGTTSTGRAGGARAARAGRGGGGGRGGRGGGGGGRGGRGGGGGGRGGRGGGGRGGGGFHGGGHGGGHR